MNTSLVCEPRARLDPTAHCELADENPKRMSVSPSPGPNYHFITAVLQTRRRANMHKKYIFLKKITPHPINQPSNHLEET